MMAPQLKAVAEKMAEETYPCSKRSVIDANFNYDQLAKQESYLAGFEARDGMESNELTHLRTLIKQVFDLEYDHLSWCEFEKQVLNAPPTDTPPLP